MDLSDCDEKSVMSLSNCSNERSPRVTQEMILSDSDSSDSNSKSLRSHTGRSGISAATPRVRQLPSSHSHSGESGVFAGPPRVRALPPCGCFAAEAGLQKLPLPRLLQVEPLGIRLQQIEDAPHHKRKRNAELVQRGMEPALMMYGTLRCFSATHRAAKVITIRNQRELPTCLYFDPHFRSGLSEVQLNDLRFVSPTLGEWLLGLPHGWTALQPLQQGCLTANLAGLCLGEHAAAAGNPGASSVSADVPKLWRSLSLFSGCGALDYALPWCTPAAYCEIDTAAICVLQARMADGSLPQAPILNDVRRITSHQITTHVDVIVAGFPCVDICKAGRKQGLQGSESTLVWEVLRIAQDIGVSMIFMENVDNLRFMTDFSHALMGELAKLGFQIAWISLSAHHVGSPQRRRRMFLLAKRGSALAVPFGPALPRGPSGVLVDARLPFLQKNKGLRFNAGRPPKSEWMTSEWEPERLRMLGNAVVPLQANLAARILSSIPW